ncbi:MAG TPA: transposase [Candidatus Tectomicrobia bacterium]|jgi:putative transposase
MQIRKGSKYRLKTTRAAGAKFVRFAGACRFVWNKILPINVHRYWAGVPRLSYAEACQLLAWWKQSEEYGWLRAVHSQVLQQCLRDLERAYANCVAGRTAPPRYRKKFLADSFRYPQGVKLNGRLVYLPMIGWVEFWHSRPIEGTIKNVTVSRQGKHWFVAFQVEQELPAPVHPSATASAEGASGALPSTDSAVGIDLGIATFAAFSDGTLHPPLNAYRRVAKKKARMQHKLAGMVQYSQNWQKQQRRIAQLDIRIANCRHDFLHTLSTETSKNHTVICLEDLQVKYMSRSARGTVAEPGRQVAQKAGLNKAILDQGWGTFRRMLEYKQAWRGGELLAVPPRYTSQKCPRCHHVSSLNLRNKPCSPA